GRLGASLTPSSRRGVKTRIRATRSRCSAMLPGVLSSPASPLLARFGACRFGARRMLRTGLRAFWPASLASVALAAFFIAATPAARVDSATNARSGARVAPPPWFYMRNNDRTSPATLVARSSVMILSGSDYEVGFLRRVRRAGWRKPILEYFHTAFAMGPAPTEGGSCRAGFEGLSTSVTWQRNSFCNGVNPNESWFLHNGAGRRIVRSADDNASLYLMNPASPAWRPFVR